MKKRIITGLIFGLLAGILDVIPMILQDLTWDANLSALSMWIVIGFFVATTELKMNAALKGILFSFLAIIPCAVLISWKEPESLIPISGMTLVLGALLGIAIHSVRKKNQKS